MCTWLVDDILDLANWSAPALGQARLKVAADGVPRFGFGLDEAQKHALDTAAGISHRAGIMVGRSPGHHGGLSQPVMEFKPTDFGPPCADFPLATTTQ